MIETIRSIELFGGSFGDKIDDLCLSRNTVKNLFKLLLIGAMTRNGSWAQGSSNWAYDHCDSIISELCADKISVNDSFNIISNAAMFHGAIVVMEKQNRSGRNIKTIAHSFADAMHIPLTKDARKTASIIQEVCVHDPNFKETYVRSFGSDCEKILINLKNFFTEYDALDIINETEKSVEASLTTSEMIAVRNNIKNIKEVYCEF